MLAERRHRLDKARSRNCLPHFGCRGHCTLCRRRDHVIESQVDGRVPGDSAVEHPAAPPDTTRHGANSAKPLSSIEVSMAGHFCAATDVALASSKKHRLMNGATFISPPMHELTSEARAGPSLTRPIASLTVWFWRLNLLSLGVCGGGGSMSTTNGHRQGLTLSLILLGGVLMAPPAQAQFTHTQITNSSSGNSSNASINVGGTRIAFISSSDLTSGNADGNEEIFLWTSGSGFSQITSTTGGFNIDPSINGDGTRIAFRSNRDLTGGNAVLDEEIFIWTSGSGFAQITGPTPNGGGPGFPSINSDGTKVAFEGTDDYTGGNADGNVEIFLWTAGSGLTQIQRAPPPAATTPLPSTATARRSPFTPTAT